MGKAGSKYPSITPSVFGTQMLMQGLFRRCYMVQKSWAKAASPPAKDLLRLRMAAVTDQAGLHHMMIVGQARIQHRHGRPMLHLEY